MRDIEEQIAQLRRTLANCDFLLSDEYSLQTFAAHIPRTREIKAHVEAQIARLEAQQEKQQCSTPSTP